MAAEGQAETPEAELVELVRSRRDSRAFEELYRRGRREIFGVCLHYLKEPARAEDACHDAFVKAWERADQIVGDSFRAWVRRIARTLCLNRIRHRDMTARKAALLRPDEHTRGQDPAQVREQLQIAHEILATLSPEQRRVFLLRHLEELSYEEIAQRTSSSTEQVRSHLQGARRNFHRRFHERTEIGQVQRHG